MTCSPVFTSLWRVGGLKESCGVLSSYIPQSMACSKVKGDLWRVFSCIYQSMACRRVEEELWRVILLYSPVYMAFKRVEGELWRVILLYLPVHGV